LADVLLDVRHIFSRVPRASKDDYCSERISEMNHLYRTALFDRHVQLGAKIVEFGGWEMPLQYPSGIVQEHLLTRSQAGLFDISHMGRFVIRGKNALEFLQKMLTNNAAALDVGWGQYTIIPNEKGGAIDDAYLYRFVEEEFLLVINAANRKRDWEHLTSAARSFKHLEIVDQTMDLAMLSLQGPKSKDILLGVLKSGQLPEPVRNALSISAINNTRVLISRTGYTGEPLCFELFLEAEAAAAIWDLLMERGACPVGLGARDTLRLEAALPLFGHEFGTDPEGEEIPIFSSPLAKYAVSFSALKGDFVGKDALFKQFHALENIVNETFENIEALPRITRPVAVIGKGVARAGNKVFFDSRPVGYITSGTMVPYWLFEGEGTASRITDQKRMRAIALALLDSRLPDGKIVDIDIRGRRIQAKIVPYHLRSEAPLYARPILCDTLKPKPIAILKKKPPKTVRTLVREAAENTLWRQKDCVNLIPSEQTASKMVRLLSIMDPCGRYAEHRAVKAFCEAEVFYYQGTKFISRIEELLKGQMAQFFGCNLVEIRLISGQMANVAVFSALVDFFNRVDRKSEQRRIRKVLNHHIIKGGHLSAQPMGALRDFVARDPKTEKPAVVNFPVLPDNPYQIDLKACRDIIDEHRPELIILGKSMTLHKEPVYELRSMIDDMGLDCILMYDMAHVLGLIGPHFQQPFAEGADVITGSTHKTFFGTQRGVVAADYEPEDLRYLLWEAIERRTFPGSVSNHHLGTLLGLLMAAYEMNHFRDDYQLRVIENAKTFARALHDCGLKVAGDPDISFTETHQVILDVGYARGAEIACRLEENNIIVNYQAAPEEEGFTASGSLRMGVSEMTRFGMEPNDFQALAQMIRDVIMENKDLKQTVSRFRKRFLDMKYCFSGDEYDDLINVLLDSL